MPAKRYGMSRSICEICGARGRHGMTTEISRKKDGVRRFVCDDHKCERAWRYNPWKYVKRWTPFEQEAYKAKHGKSPAEQEMEEMGKNRGPRLSNEAKAAVDEHVWKPGADHSWGFATRMANQLKKDYPKLLAPYSNHSLIYRILQTQKAGPPNYTPPRVVPVPPVTIPVVPMGVLPEFNKLAAQSQVDLHKASEDISAPLREQLRKDLVSGAAFLEEPQDYQQTRLDALFDVSVAQLHYLVICNRFESLRTISSLLAEEVSRA